MKNEQKMKLSINSPIRSDPQAWLSCHFNVQQIAPLRYFNHGSGMPIEGSVQKISLRKGVPGVRRTARLF